MKSTLQINYSLSRFSIPKLIFINKIPEISCVYFCKNLETNKLYVGKTTNLRRRISAHYQNINKGIINRFYSSIINHGNLAFTWGVLEVLEKEKLCERESFWIEKLGTKNNGYNMTSGGDGGSTTQNRHWINKEGINKMVKHPEKFINDGWNLGRDITVNINKGTTKGRIKVFKGTNIRTIPIEDWPFFEENGYKKGDPSRISPTTLGKKRISKKGLASKYVKEDQLEAFFTDGWLLHKDFLKL